MAKYGGQEPHVDKVYFTKAEDDPWRYAGVSDNCATIIPGKNTTNKHIFTVNKYYTIAGVGHCHELQERSKNDSLELAAAKEKGLRIIESWINDDGYAESVLKKCY